MRDGRDDEFARFGFEPSLVFNILGVESVPVNYTCSVCRYGFLSLNVFSKDVTN